MLSLETIPLAGDDLCVDMRQFLGGSEIPPVPQLTEVFMDAYQHILDEFEVFFSLRSLLTARG